MNVDSVIQQGPKEACSAARRETGPGSLQMSAVGAPRPSLLHRKSALRAAMRRLAGFNQPFSSG
jgi:hypothetical protein